MTVAEVLDRLAAGTMTLMEAEADFRRRAWPRQQPRASLAQAYQGDIGAAPDPDSWDAVNADSRLTTEAYQRLAAARKSAIL